MHFLKSVEDYEKEKNDRGYVGPLRNELDIFNDIYAKFKSINVQILKSEDFKKFFEKEERCCIATIDDNKIIVCDNSTGNKWTEEFDIDDYKFAIDWSIGKIEYQDYLDYKKEKKYNYIISIWESEENRELGECFDYIETFKNMEDAINVAKRITKLHNYACSEVIDSNDKCVFWTDGYESTYYFEKLNSYKDVLDKCKEYQDFELDKFNFYYTINSIEPNLPENDLLRLMNICERCSSDYIQSSVLAFDLTNAIYFDHYILLDDLEKVASEDIREMYNSNKIYLLENYKSLEKEEEGII